MQVGVMRTRNPKALILTAAILFGIAAMATGLVSSRMRDMATKRSQSREVTSEPVQPMSNPRIVVRKSKRTLEFFDGDRLTKTYTIALGFAPAGDKEKQSDGKTPEGDFYVFVKNPKSKFHLSLGLSYPSKDDAVRGLADSLITRTQHDQIIAAIDAGKMPPQQTALGGEIYIHGGGVGRDWTWGCIALSNSDIEEIYNAVRVGAKVTIKP